MTRLIIRTRYKTPPSLLWQLRQSNQIISSLKLKLKQRNEELRSLRIKCLTNIRKLNSSLNKSRRK